MFRAVFREAKNTEAKSVFTTLPFPPDRLVPPSTTAAITSNS